jgi:hypothetical protein
VPGAASRRPWSRADACSSTAAIPCGRFRSQTDRPDRPEAALPGPIGGVSEPRTNIL